MDRVVYNLCSPGTREASSSTCVVPEHGASASDQNIEVHARLLIMFHNADAKRACNVVWLRLLVSRVGSCSGHVLEEDVPGLHVSVRPELVPEVR